MKQNQVLPCPGPLLVSLYPNQNSIEKIAGWKKK
jgi:hypothetical protein